MITLSRLNNRCHQAIVFWEYSVLLIASVVKVVYFIEFYVYNDNLKVC